MTVASETRKSPTYVGNGVTASFPFSFKIFAKGDLRVVFTVIATGVNADLVLDSDYSVTLNPDQNTNPGGSITYPVIGAPMDALHSLVIVSDVDALQETDIANLGGFYPEVIEDALDREMIVVQQLQEQADRALTFPITETAGAALPSSVARASMFLAFNSLGDPVAVQGNPSQLATDISDPTNAALGDNLVAVQIVETGAFARTQHDKNADIVSATDFKNLDNTQVLGNGVRQNATGIQRALDTGAAVWFPGKGAVYLVAAALSMPAGGAMYAERNATLKASGAISQIATMGANSRVRGVNFDCNNTAGALTINADGANRALYVKEVNGCTIDDAYFTKYRSGGINFDSSAAGVECAHHIVSRCTFEAGYSWPGTKPDNLQLGVYCGSSASAQNLQIGSMAAQQVEACDVHSISFYGNKFLEGQYGLALHRCSGITATGNVFARMSRGVSIQQQSHDITISGNKFFDLDTTGVHMAYGVYAVTVIGNTIRGTFANDNVGIQAYYGVKNILIVGNVLDSAFDQWAGGASLEQRAPSAGIRIGQYAQNVTIVGNSIRGYIVGINLKSTIYEGTITPADPNYYFTGLEHIMCASNAIKFDYEVLVATTYRAQFLQSNSYGVWANKTGNWEDTTLGGLTCRNIRVLNATSDSCRFPFVVQKVANVAANPVHWKDFWIAESYAFNSLGVDASVLSGTNTSDTIYESNNSWTKTFVPTFAGSATAGVHTYTQRVGWYREMGKTIHFGVNITLSVKDAAMAGNAQIQGLPYASTATGGRNQAVHIGIWSNFTFAGHTNISAYIQPNATVIDLIKNASAAASVFVPAGDCGLIQIAITGTYVRD